MLSKLGSDLMCIHLKNEWTCLIIICFPSCLVRAQSLPRPAEALGLWTGEFDSRRLTAGGAGTKLGSPLKFLCHVELCWSPGGLALPWRLTWHKPVFPQDLYGLYEPRYRPYDSATPAYAENYRYPDPERPSSRASHCSDRPPAR